MFDHEGRTTRRVDGLALAACLAAVGPGTANAAPHTVALTMYVRLDQVEMGPSGAGHGKVGDVDRIRLTYDANAVDPATRRAPLLSFQHLITGQHLPPRLDPAAMPVNDSWIDLSQAPYRVHFKASVVHGEPIVIEVDESTRRLTIHRPNNTTAVLISGPYWIDSTQERSASRR